MSTTNEPAPPVNANKALWEKGDFTRLAVTMRESGEALVNTLGITPGIEVLDLGCGDGTTALPAAKLGAKVLGVDIARPSCTPSWTPSSTSRTRARATMPEDLRDLPARDGRGPGDVS